MLLGLDSIDHAIQHVVDLAEACLRRSHTGPDGGHYRRLSDALAEAVLQVECPESLTETAYIKDQMGAQDVVPLLEQVRKTRRKDST